MISKVCCAMHYKGNRFWMRTSAAFLSLSFLFSFLSSFLLIFLSTELRACVRVCFSLLVCCCYVFPCFFQNSSVVFWSFALNDWWQIVWYVKFPYHPCIFSDSFASLCNQPKFLFMLFHWLFIVSSEPWNGLSLLIYVYCPLLCVCCEQMQTNFCIYPPF